MKIEGNETTINRQSTNGKRPVELEIEIGISNDFHQIKFGFQLFLFFDYNGN